MNNTIFVACERECRYKVREGHPHFCGNKNDIKIGVEGTCLSYAKDEEFELNKTIETLVNNALEKHGIKKKK